MNDLYVVFDNRVDVPYEIKEVVGNKKFGEIILKRKLLKEHFQDRLSHTGVKTQSFSLSMHEDCENLEKDVILIPENIRIVHVFSSHIVENMGEFEILIKKMQYINVNTVVMSPDIAMAVFTNSKDYVRYIRTTVKQNDCFMPLQNEQYQTISTDAFVDLRNIGNLIKCVTGAFDARFFNSLKGNDYTITKTSTNIKKIESEYNFYHLLPDEMKSWFVLPYNLQKDDKTASYTMERYHMTDIAIKWVHGAINKQEFEELLEKLFYFISVRNSKPTDSDTYKHMERELYVNKLLERVAELKKSAEYERLNTFVKYGTTYSDFEDIIKDYLKLYEVNTKTFEQKTEMTIGHGDYCFSNILYNRETKIIKLIDPKGANKESDLWTNPYYDVAKLSHSICGRYDFFNNGLFDITYNSKKQFELSIEFNNSEYVEIFKRKAEEYGFNYRTIRIYEASLFLSMLPLHLDNPQKVFGFVLNAINILEEIKNHE